MLLSPPLLLMALGLRKTLNVKINTDAKLAKTPVNAAIRIPQLVGTISVMILGRGLPDQLIRY